MQFGCAFSHHKICFFCATCVKQELEHLGTEHLYEGLDQKVRPKKRHSNAAATAGGHGSGGQHAMNRVKHNLVG